MSYRPHEYFRRELYNLLGQEIESGELPDDENLIGEMVRNICVENASTLARQGGQDQAVLSSAEAHLVEN
jgi:glucuronate isomerase